MSRPAFLLCAVACSSTSDQGTSVQSIAMDAPWTAHTVYAGVLSGSDGVNMADIDGDGDLDIASSWEQSSKTTVSYNPGCGAVGQWPTVTLPLTTTGCEDSVFADVDGDGLLDVITAGSSGFRVYVHFQNPGGTWTGMVIGASSGVQRWISVAFGDLSGDGIPDVIAGGYSSGASVDYFTSNTPRVASSWTRTVISAVGAAYSMVPMDVDHDGDTDLLLSDRDTILTTPPNYSLRGSRWLEAPLWTNHPIWNVGNMRYLYADDYKILSGTASSLGSSLRLNGWKTENVPTPGSVGWFNAVWPGDIDKDGREDVAISYSHADGSLSGVVWLRRTTHGWERGEVSGAPGSKFDNLYLVDMDCDGDLDIVTSEQGVKGVDPPSAQLGVLWYENPLEI